jgi:hypothetical protein
MSQGLIDLNCILSRMSHHYHHVRHQDHHVRCTQESLRTAAINNGPVTPSN